MVEKQNKVAIINQNINICENTIYDCEVKIRVAKKTKDKDMIKNVTEVMVKMEKALDEWNKILKEIK